MISPEKFTAEQQSDNQPDSQQPNRSRNQSRAVLGWLRWPSNCVQLARLESAGQLQPTQASLAKYHNTRTARVIAAEARDVLGGNGLLLKNGVTRHQADIEAIHTYEGTESVQALLISRYLTGYGAFS